MSSSTRSRKVERTSSAVADLRSRGRRATLWNMVKSLLIPNKVVTTFAACTSSGRRKRRVEKIRRQGVPPTQRPRDLPRDPPEAQESSHAQRIQSVYITELQHRLASCSNSSVNVSCSNVAITSSERSGREISRNVRAQEVTPQNSPVRATIIPSTTTVQIENSQAQFQEDVDLPEVRNLAADINSDDEILSRQLSQNLQLTNSPDPSCPTVDEEVTVERRNDSDARAEEREDFHGWRNSSVEVTIHRPKTLRWIPSGLEVGDKVLWLTDKHPEKGTVRWVGTIRDQYYAGVEFERKVGNSSGIYGYSGGLYSRLFTCELGFGRFIPVPELVLYSDYHESSHKGGLICIICRDDFVLEEDDNDSNGEGKMVATPCGHLYHSKCLFDWLATPTRSRNNNSRKEKGCPHCQRKITRNDVIRLFPAAV